MSAGVAYFGSRIPRHVAADMQELAARGFTGVLHTFSENDLAYYRETMARIVAASHDAGLAVHLAPWGVCQLFGGEAESRFTSHRRDVGQVLDDGRSTPSGCPNDPRVRAFVHEWIDAAVDTGADSILCDEPHWVHPEHFGISSERWGCRCEYCAERFGGELPATLTPEVLAFRERCLIDFIGDFVARIDRQGAKPTVCLLPLTGGVHGINDWSAVAALPGVHTFGTDPYWKAFGEDAEAMVREYARRVVDLAGAHGVAPQLWIQGFRMEPEDADDIRAAVRIARDAGIEDVWTWGFEACGHMSALAGSDPAFVWEVLCDALLAVERPEADRLSRTSTHPPGLDAPRR
jgi:hypothetical protein